jgi:hypothetical protein
MYIAPTVPDSVVPEKLSTIRIFRRSVMMGIQLSFTWNNFRTGSPLWPYLAQERHFLASAFGVCEALQPHLRHAKI